MNDDRRRLMLMGALLAAAAAPRARARGAASRTARTQALLRSAEADLARGEAKAAELGFEEAAALEHAADIELGIVRSLMQQGHYRRARDFAAHVAGAHPEDIRGALMHAWLLALGGQAALARRALQQAGQRHPGDPGLAQLREALAHGIAAPGERLQALPLRAASYGDPALREAQVLASAVSLGDGRLLAPALDARPPALVVRNGLGTTHAVRVLRPLPELGLLLLEAGRSLRGAPDVAPRDPFPGSPLALVEFAAPARGEAWPWLRPGFAGMPEADPALRPLGNEMPPGPRGGAVFDVTGRLAGIATRGPAGDRLVPASALRYALPDLPAVTASTTRRPLDEIYEQALPLVWQLLAGPG